MFPIVTARSLLIASSMLVLLTSTPCTVRAQGPKILKEKEANLSEGLVPLAKSYDRTSPRKSWSGLLKLCAEGKWQIGAHYLNLGEVAAADRASMGPVLVRQLWEVLQKVTLVDAETLDDTPMGPLTDDNVPHNYVVGATLAQGEGGDEVWLRRVKDTGTQQYVWVVTRRTVSMIPAWHRRLVKKATDQRQARAIINKGLGNPPAQWGIGNPRGTVDKFLELTTAGSYLEAAGLLDLSSVAQAQQGNVGPRLARRLAIVLKKIHPTSFKDMSNDPAGAPEKGVPFDEELVVGAKLDQGQTLQLRVAHYPLKAGEPIWLFSGATVSDIDLLYEQFGYGWAGDKLPPLFFEIELWSIQLWQWLGLLIMLFTASLFGYLTSFILLKILIWLSAFTAWTWDDLVAVKARGPLVMIMAVVGYAIQVPLLAMHQAPHDLTMGICKLFAILGAGWFVIRLVDVISELLYQHFKARDDDMGITMVPVARKILKPILVVIILVVALQNVGMNVGGLLAGLGIGGLAFALAAKDTLANLFGSIAMAFDRPFKVGDYVKTGEHTGTVEDVGLRSTRLRTVARTLVTIPNAQLADSRVENFSVRERIRLVLTIGVQYDTSMDQIRYIIDEFKRYLLANSQVWQEGWRVRFVGYGASSQDIEVACYLNTNEFGVFTAIREEILMDLGDIVSQAGAEFAYPSQTIYVGKDSQADSKKAKQARVLVEQRREDGELCIPEIPDKVRDAIMNPKPPA